MKFNYLRIIGISIVLISVILFAFQPSGIFKSTIIMLMIIGMFVLCIYVGYVSFFGLIDAIKELIKGGKNGKKQKTTRTRT